MGLPKKIFATGAGLTLVAGAGLGYVGYENRHDVPQDAFMPLDHWPPERDLGAVTNICDVSRPDCTAETALTSYVAQGHIVNLQYKDISKNLAKAIISTEDERFFQHDGVDYDSWFKALVKNAIEREFAYGASTITRQLAEAKFCQYITAKETDLCEKPANLTKAEQASQQVYESQVALRIEAAELKKAGGDKMIAKQNIFADYANRVYFGRGAFGITAASDIYFGVEPHELTLFQATILAGMLTDPANMDVLVSTYKNMSPEQLEEYKSNMIRLRDKFHHVVRRMLANEAISEEEAGALRAEMESHYIKNENGSYTFVPIFKPYDPSKRSTGLRTQRADKLGARHAIDYVFAQASEASGLSVEALKTGGYTINTTIDPRVQVALNYAIRSNKVVMKDPNLDEAGVVLGQAGDIQAMVGGTNYKKLQLNLATQGGGDSGSAFKPIVVAAAIDQGWNLNTDLRAPAKVVVKGAPGSKDWVISQGQECENLIPPQPLATCHASMQRLLEISSNALPGQILNAFGTKAITGAMQEIGINIEDLEDPTVTLGVGKHTPLEGATAINGLIANGGVYTPTSIVASIRRADGKFVSMTKPQAGKRVFSAEAANQTAIAMNGVIRRGTVQGVMTPPAGLDSVVGKTGTGDFRKTLQFVSTFCDARDGLRTSFIRIANPHAATPIKKIKYSRNVAADTNKMIRKIQGSEPCSVVEMTKP